MKKILSFVLVLAMIASMMCVSASATFVVGTGGGNPSGSISDGADAPTSTSGASEITATITSTATDKYAIELTYSQATITVNNTAVWNVNTLQYEGTTKIKVGNNEEVTCSSATDPAPFEGIATFTVTNYSSKGISVATSVTPLGGVDIDIKNGSVNIADVTDTIAAVTPVNGGSGRAVTKTYTASMDSADWAAAFAATSNGTVQIASITFTFGAQGNAQGQ